MENPTFRRALALSFPLYYEMKQKYSVKKKGGNSGHTLSETKRAALIPRNKYNSIF